MDQNCNFLVEILEFGGRKFVSLDRSWSKLRFDFLILYLALILNEIQMQM